MKFFYKRYAPGLFRPVIPIEIKANAKPVRYEALIGSGADLCIFDGQIAQVLGISVRKGQKRFVGGITGTERPFFVHPVLILIGGWDYEIARSEEHTSELQSQFHLVCRLLLEKTI